MRCTGVYKAIITCTHRGLRGLARDQSSFFGEVGCAGARVFRIGQGAMREWKGQTGGGAGVTAVSAVAEKNEAGCGRGEGEKGGEGLEAGRGRGSPPACAAMQSSIGGRESVRKRERERERERECE